MLKKNLLGALLAFCAAASATPQVLAQSTFTSLAPIQSVWDLSRQPCNGGGANEFVRNPNEAQIKANRVIALKDIGLQVAMPQLPDLERLHIKLYLNDKSRGVTDHYILFSQGDLGPPAAAIVVTALPVSLRSTASALNAAASMQARSSRQQPFTVTKMNGPFGEAIEVLVPNRVSSHCFPTADYQIAGDAGRLDTLGISRFAVIGDKLVEFAIIVKSPSESTREQAISAARKLMDSYWLNLSPL